MDFPGGSVKSLPAVQETLVQSVGQEDHLEKEMATHSSILAWTIPWTRNLAGYGVSKSQTGLSNFTFTLCIFIGQGAVILWGKKSFVEASKDFLYPYNLFILYSIYRCMYKCSISKSYLTLWPLGPDPPGLLYPWDFPSKNTGVGCISFSRRSSWPRDWTSISCTAGRFFTTKPLGKPICIYAYTLYYIET